MAIGASQLPGVDVNGRVGSLGSFEILVDGVLVFSRLEGGGFPDPGDVVALLETGISCVDPRIKAQTIRHAFARRIMHMLMFTYLCASDPPYALILCTKDNQYNSTVGTLLYDVCTPKYSTTHAVVNGILADRMPFDASVPPLTRHQQRGHGIKPHVRAQPQVGMCVEARPQVGGLGVCDLATPEEANKKVPPPPPKKPTKKQFKAIEAAYEAWQGDIRRENKGLPPLQWVPPAF
eukprot:jgi/Mesvir1/1767/Mv24138-RA.1